MSVGGEASAAACRSRTLTDASRFYARPAGCPSVGLPNPKSQYPLVPLKPVLPQQVRQVRPASRQNPVECTVRRRLGQRQQPPQRTHTLRDSVPPEAAAL